jgi:hypothetical protein
MSTQEKVAAGLAGSGVSLTFGGSVPCADVVKKHIKIPPIPDDVTPSTEIRVRAWTDHECGHISCGSKPWDIKVLRDKVIRNLAFALEDCRVDRENGKKFPGTLDNRRRMFDDVRPELDCANVLQAAYWSLYEVVKQYSSVEVAAEYWAGRLGIPPAAEVISQLLTAISGQIDRVRITNDPDEVVAICHAIKAIWKEFFKNGDPADGDGEEEQDKRMSDGGQFNEKKKQDKKNKKNKKSKPDSNGDSGGESDEDSDNEPGDSGDEQDDDSDEDSEDGEDKDSEKSKGKKSKKSKSKKSDTGDDDEDSDGDDGEGNDVGDSDETDDSDEDGDGDETDGGDEDGKDSDEKSDKSDKSNKSDKGDDSAKDSDTDEGDEDADGDADGDEDEDSDKDKGKDKGENDEDKSDEDGDGSGEDSDDKGESEGDDGDSDDADDEGGKGKSKGDDSDDEGEEEGDSKGDDGDSADGDEASSGKDSGTDDEGGGSDKAGNDKKTDPEQQMNSMTSDMRPLSEIEANKIASDLKYTGDEDSEDKPGYLAYTDRDVEEDMPIAAGNVIFYYDYGTGKSKTITSDAFRSEVRSKIGVLQRRLIRDLQSRQRMWVRDRLRGTVDDTRLARVGTDDGRVFKRRLRRPAIDTAVTLLLDLSDSMRGQKKYLCAQLGYAIAEALSIMQIPYEALGFTTAGEGYKQPTYYHRQSVLRKVVIKPFSKNIRSENVLRFFNAAGCSGNGTIEGEALLWAAQRIAVRNESRKIIIVICDGSTCGGGMHDASAQKFEEHLTSAVQRVNKAGIETIGVGVLTDVVKLYYPRWAVYTSIDSILTDFYPVFGGLLRGERSIEAPGAAEAKV